MESSKGNSVEQPEQVESRRRRVFLSWHISIENGQVAACCRDRTPGTLRSFSDLCIEATPPHLGLSNGLERSRPIKRPPPAPYSSTKILKFRRPDRHADVIALLHELAEEERALENDPLLQELVRRAKEIPRRLSLLRPRIP